MTCKVISRLPSDIPICDIKLGEIGVITDWGGSARYNGKIVQRHRDGIICFGDYAGCIWSDIFDNENYRVRLLRPGDMIEVGEFNIESSN